MLTIHFLDIKYLLSISEEEIFKYIYKKYI